MLDHQRLTDLFSEAVALPLARREAFLDSACSGEPELRREVLDLLRHDDSASAAFDVAAEQIVQPEQDTIGPYELLEPVGEGGMAVVYKAQQHRPVRRIVAVKLIKLGMDTRQFVARFESERQALAMMDHPNVARVYDAGSTKIGRPYFVMEYVPGRRILEWCDARLLTVRERLELFIPVCEAVEHAHRKGIIHRDLKNSNVLVTDVDGRALPKVIDFGVAKAVSEPLTDSTVFTERGQIIGTPEYMSPEQAERGALDIDTRSDVYSLGVLLYQLLAGVQPIPSELLRKGSYEQVQRIIREAAPPRPSTRLSELAGEDATRIAQCRHTALPTLIRELRSELEWIPLKAMRKDREQRYRSASELSDDIRNYLSGRPLIAGPESGWYRARKFLRRHRAAVAASAAMLLLLVGGVVATTWQAVRATRAEHHADREAADARKQTSIAVAVNGLTRDMIKRANRGQQKGNPNVTVRAVMDAAAADLNTGAVSHGLEVDAALRSAVGRTYVELGLYDAAEPLLRRALEQASLAYGEQHLDVARHRVDLATLLTHKGDFKGAEALFRQVLEAHHEAHPHVAAAMNGLGAILWNRRDFAGAESQFLAVLAMRRQLHGNEHKEVAYCLNNLATALLSRGDLVAAEPLYREALALRRKLHGDESIEAAQTLANLGELLRRKQDLPAAETMTREALAIQKKLFGAEHPEVATTLSNLAGLLAQKNDYESAESLFREALAIRQKLQGNDHLETLLEMHGYAEMLHKAGRDSEAELMTRRVVATATTKPALGPANVYTKEFARLHATILDSMGRRAEATAVRKEFSLPDPATRASTRPATRSE